MTSPIDKSMAHIFFGSWQIVNLFMIWVGTPVTKLEMTLARHWFKAGRKKSFWVDGREMADNLKQHFKCPLYHHLSINLFEIPDSLGRQPQICSFRTSSDHQQAISYSSTDNDGLNFGIWCHAQVTNESCSSPRCPGSNPVSEDISMRAKQGLQIV